MSNESNNRQHKRVNKNLTCIVKKKSENESLSIMEFLAKDLSTGGLFLISEDLSLFDLGDTVNILVDANGERYYEGTAKIVRSVKILDDAENDDYSGYGLMFTHQEDSLFKFLDTETNPHKEEEIVLFNSDST